VLPTELSDDIVCSVAGFGRLVRFVVPGLFLVQRNAED